MEELLPPTFTKKPRIRQEDDGNKLIFECQLISCPRPMIKWYKEEEKIKDDERTEIKINEIGSNKYLISLTLDNVIETDAGVYKAKAKNNQGEVSTSINLDFACKFKLLLLLYLR